MNNRKDKFGIYYHIFADNKDFYEDNYRKANSRYKELLLSGEQNMRLYQCWYRSKEEALSFDDCAENENCLKYKGEFPL